MQYRLSILLTLFTSLSLCVSHFTDPDFLLTDGDILNYALGIQQLNYAFYHTALKSYSQPHFQQSGYPDWVRDRFQQIMNHEKTHIQFLTMAIRERDRELSMNVSHTSRVKAVRPCRYNFPHADTRSFIELSAIVANVATSALNGMLPFINDKGYLTAFGSILGVEARHAGWINSALLWVNPWNTAFETPLDANQARSWFSTFIASCPGPNFLSPSKSFPKLSLPRTALPGKIVSFEIGGSSEVEKEKDTAKAKLTEKGKAEVVGGGSYLKSAPGPQHDTGTQLQLFLHCLTGTGIYTSLVDMTRQQVMIPQGMKGTAYCLVSTDKDKATDSSTMAGPAVVMCPFEADGRIHAND